MKTLGIIGGLGPETTSEFYLEIIFGCYRKNKIQRPPVLIWNIPIKYNIEKDLIENSQGEERYIPYLIEAARKLESAGADFLVIPCNSVHIFIDKVRKSVNIPVLSIVEETAKFLKEKRLKKVGILATSTSIKKDLYKNTLAKFNIEQVIPNDYNQAKIGRIVNNIVLKKETNKDRGELLKIVDGFKKKNLKTVILACTDLQILIPSHDQIEIFDTMKILADATVAKILKEN